MYGKPTLWAAIESVSPNRLVEADDLPNNVYLALAEAPAGGDVVHRQEGAIVEELRGFAQRSGGAYREAAQEAPEALIVRTLCKHPELPEGVRLLRQVLELRRVAVWRIKSREVKDFWVLGEPIKILPKNALRSPWVFYIAIAILLCACIALGWSMTR